MKKEDEFDWHMFELLLDDAEMDSIVDDLGVDEHSELMRDEDGIGYFVDCYDPDEVDYIRKVG